VLQSLNQTSGESVKQRSPYFKQTRPYAPDCPVESINDSVTEITWSRRTIDCGRPRGDVMSL